MNHIRSNLVGYAAVFLAITGGAAALPGRETVQSNDLKPNAVKAKHIKDGQIGSADVAADSLTGADIDESSLAIAGGGTPSGPAGGDLAGDFPNPQIAAGAVGTDEVATDSLTGADINEAALDLPARPVAAPPGSCNPTGTSGFDRCVLRRIEFVGPGLNQAVVLASLSWFTDGLGGAGECELRIGSSVMDSAAIGTEDSSNANAEHTLETTLIGMPSGPNGADADLSVHCSETESQIQFPRVTLAVLGDVAPVG